MTDRIKGLAVIFKNEIRDDDCQAIVNAILLFENVADVKMSIHNADDVINRQKIRMEYFDKLVKVLNDKEKK